MKMKKIILPVVLLIMIITFSCSKDGGLWYNHKWEDLHPKGQTTSATSCDTGGTISYASKIKPILTTNCNLNSGSFCHDGNGGLNYNTTSNVQSDATSGQILDRLRRSVSTPGHMPQGAGSLPNCDTLKIRLWIIQGAFNN